MRQTTPYDTGTACEARPWIPYGTSVSEVTPAENFGKVDFDDDEGHTVAVVRISREPGGPYLADIESLCEDGELVVRITSSNTVVVVDAGPRVNNCADSSRTDVTESGRISDTR